MKVLNFYADEDFFGFAALAFIAFAVMCVAALLIQTGSEEYFSLHNLGNISISVGILIPFYLKIMKKGSKKYGRFLTLFIVAYIIYLALFGLTGLVLAGVALLVFFGVKFISFGLFMNKPLLEIDQAGIKVRNMMSGETFAPWGDIEKLTITTMPVPGMFARPNGYLRAVLKHPEAYASRQNFAGKLDKELLGSSVYIGLRTLYVTPEKLIANIQNYLTQEKIDVPLET